MSLLCSLPLAAALFASCGQPAPLAVGYVEGDFVLLAPIEVATVKSLAVKRGDAVSPGQKLAELEKDDALIAVARSEAALAQAQAVLADLQLGKRPEEIDVLEAAVQSAQAQLAEARRVQARVADLLDRGITTKAQNDEASTAVETAEAELAQAKANLAVGGLSARPEAIKASQNQVKQAQAELDQANWRLSQRTIVAPSAGRIDDLVRYPGDTAGPSAPVISMLPEGAVKLTLFVPEVAFSSLKVGQLLAVHCDGCAPDLTARISYISPDPEFTPPVIYSLETRQKLVYLVEARPEGDATALQPGQIVDVEVGSE